MSFSQEKKKASSQTLDKTSNQAFLEEIRDRQKEILSSYEIIRDNYVILFQNIYNIEPEAVDKLDTEIIERISIKEIKINEAKENLGWNFEENITNYMNKDITEEEMQEASDEITNYKPDNIYNKNLKEKIDKADTLTQLQEILSDKKRYHEKKSMFINEKNSCISPNSYKKRVLKNSLDNYEKNFGEIETLLEEYQDGFKNIYNDISNAQNE